MTSLLIENATGIFSGRPGAAMRTSGSIRIRDGVIVDIGALQAEPNERRLDARGCVVYPGLISTHHHLFQSVLKGVRSGINLPLAGWLRSRLGKSVGLEHEPSNKLVGVELDGDPAPFPPGDPPLPADLLSDELDKLSRDPIYEAAVLAAVT